MRFSFGLLLIVTSFISCKEKKTPADTIIMGGYIYTMDEKNPEVEAVAIQNGKIIFAGSAMESKSYIGDGTELINLEGKTMTPGFIESHGHFMDLGFSEIYLDLMSTTSYEEMIEKVKSAVAQAKPGQWILGNGWHQDKWGTKPKTMVKGFPTHQLLSDVSPNNPVVFFHASGHALLANAKAMQLAGVNLLVIEKMGKQTVEGGEIIRDALGNPTGLFNEEAQNLILKKIPEASLGQNIEAVENAMAASARNGITSFHDAGATRETIELYKKFRSGNKLTTRLYVMVTGRDPELVYEHLRKGPEIDSAHFLTIRSIKLNADGALGSRGAWLIEPYTDRPDFSGMATISMDTVLKISREALKYGFQVCSHAIGDRTNKEILDRFEIAFKENPDKAKDARFRIEHAQHLDPTDIPRFGQLGVIASMEAIHMSSDRPWAIDRLGEKRIVEGAYMWQSLLKSGAKVINGTDVPVEPINPIANFYASITRKTLKGKPEGGYEPAEKMTREQTLRSYTLDAAFGEFEEEYKGSIETGKLADFTIFTKDIMTIPESEILSTEIAMTIVNGKIIYENSY